MRTLSLALGLGLLASAGPVLDAADSAQLQELLQDRQRPRRQSQAALLLVQSRTPEAEDTVRRGLRQTSAPEVFASLAAAVQLCRDRRFVDELLAALSADRRPLRQTAAETLAAIADDAVVKRLAVLAADPQAEVSERQAALWVLGRSGRKSAVPVLLDHLGDTEALRGAAAEALADLTGQTFGADACRWHRWWDEHKDLANEHWLEERLAFQTTRAHRLEDDLGQTRSQVLLLHQQLHARLPAADRLGHIQSLVEAEDPAVRALAVAWSVELWPAADRLGRRSLAEVLLKLSHDDAVEVQRPAALALGRVQDERACDRLLALLREGPAPVRAAAARALAEQARGTGPEALARLYQVVPALQKALEDPALEVVVEAAEALGALGVPEAGPVLTALLHHPSAPVRQTAAQALERVADTAVLDGLLRALDEPVAPVRFNLVGALGHAAGDGRVLPEAQRTQLLARLQEVLVHDTDPGVRGRAATVLGACGSPAVLPALWARVTAAEDSRVQERAWAALAEVVARSGDVALLRTWDHTLAEAKQGPRRLQLLGEVCAAWQKRGDRGLAGAAQELLIQAQLDQGKWAAAAPAVRTLLGEATADADVDRRLGWLLAVGEQAFKEGERAEALRAAQAAQPFLGQHPRLAEDFAAPGEAGQAVGDPWSLALSSGRRQAILHHNVALTLPGVRDNAPLDHHLPLSAPLPLQPSGR